MRPLVDQEALVEFLERASADEARQAEAALAAMAAACRLAKVVLAHAEEAISEQADG